MSIEQFAAFYVNVVEPVFRFLLFAVIAISFLYLLNVVRDAKKKTDIINGAFNFILKLVTKSVVLLGKVLLFSIKMLQKVFKVINASVRDFFNSKI